MSYIQRLIETYDLCCDNPNILDSGNLIPIAHTSQLAQIEIVLDGNGNFRRASVIDKPDRETVIPCTEESAGRTSGPVAHPLCDKLKYVAGDYSNTISTAHSQYIKTLEEWVSFSKNKRLESILIYVKKNSVVKDLVKHKVFFTDKNGIPLEKWNGTNKDTPEIFKSLTSGNQMDAFVRWRVEIDGDLISGTWEDHVLKSSWTEYCSTQESISGLCMVTGDHTTLAKQHPKRIRNSGDGAKLISSNDLNNFTFRGKFTTPEEALGVGFVASQKAHSALRWLITRQSVWTDGQTIVSWAINGAKIPDPWADSLALTLGIESSGDEDKATDVGQAYARRLNKSIAGYKSNLSGNQNIVLMVIDAATPGRLSVTYYRDLNSSEFLDRLENWHLKYSWYQNFGKNRRFVGAPSPRDIAEAAYGKRISDSLKKATIERILPCIIDSVPFPKDLIDSISQRLYNKSGMEYWDFEKCLGIFCALYRGKFDQKEYKMSLETDRASRDYLFGRLLAIAQRIESVALSASEKNRPTTAERLFHSFADRPSSTWFTIRKAINPYMLKLSNKDMGKGFIFNMETLLSEVIASFNEDDFLNNKQLSSEFLLGYYVQRKDFYKKKPEDKEEDVDEDGDNEDLDD